VVLEKVEDKDEECCVDEIKVDADRNLT
jgi:hypothetical protein